MVYRLQERQLDSHPLVRSLTDILLDGLVTLLGLYEAYLKHYPYAEARLRRETVKNPKFATFIGVSPVSVLHICIYIYICIRYAPQSSPRCVLSTLCSLLLHALLETDRVQD